MSASAGEWTPPEDPDVDAIRDESEADAKAGRYELALAKHVWWHENVNKYQPSMSAVRLSFGLGEWHRLADVYPPALAKLKEVRDHVGDRIKSNVEKNVSFEDFQEFAAINRELEENEKTVAMFKFVDQENPGGARTAFHVSQPALIEAKEYVLCGKYLEPEKYSDILLKRFGVENQIKTNPMYDDMMRASLDRSFINDAATLVALLAINDRKSEAEAAIAKFKTVVSDAKFHKDLAAALDNACAGNCQLPNH